MIHVDASNGVLAVHCAYGGRERGVQLLPLAHQVCEQHGETFRVRVALWMVTVRRELGLDRREVLENAVVNDRDLAVRATVGVGVRLRRAAVRRPSRVSDADSGTERVTV